MYKNHIRFLRFRKKSEETSPEQQVFSFWMEFFVEATKSSCDNIIRFPVSVIQAFISSLYLIPLMEINTFLQCIFRTPEVETGGELIAGHVEGCVKATRCYTYLRTNEECSH